MALLQTLPPDGGGHRRLQLTSPATGVELGSVEIQGAADVKAAIDRAHKAAPEWQATGFRERGRILQRALRFLVDHQEEFVDVIVGETGKPREEAIASEVIPACDALQFYAKRSKKILADRTIPLHLMRSKRLTVSYRPLGVVGIITPWNVPFLLALNPTVQALMAGNCVVLKPSEVTPFSGQLLERLFHEAGLPPDVFQLVIGDGETGAALVEGGVDKISFTGSVATGRKVGEACARQLIPCTLELGGKDAMIVCEDADLDRAAAGAVFGAFCNSGQICVSTERVYVVESIAHEFQQKVLEKTAELRQGPAGESDVGAIIHGPQLDIIEAHVADALERGATVLAGGRRNPDLSGAYYEPTVLAQVDHTMRVMREETFGPILPLMTVPNEEEAIRLANDSPYGLGGSVWTRDKGRGEAICKQIGAGGMTVNDCLVTYAVPEAPFGGRGQSGIGQVNGETGLRSYCHAQTILVDRVGSVSEFLWFPYRASKGRRFEQLTKLLWRTPLGRLLS